MQRKQLMRLGMSLLAVSLASCGGTPAQDSGSTTKSESDVSSSTSSTETIDSKYASYKKLEDFDKGTNTFKDAAGNDQILSRRLLEENGGTPCLTPLGEQRILVVPLGLEDDDTISPANPSIVASGRTAAQTEERLNQIEKIFFGKAEETGWQSVKSYYETSSFGKCTVTGTVMRSNGGWYRPGKKPKDYDSSQALRDMQSFYTSEYAKENHGALGADAHDWKWFDQDGDGYIDTIWIVYSAPIHAYETSASGNNYWAYVSRTSNRPNKSNPNPMCYAWASIDFMDEGSGYAPGTDGHTFIHETGHIFGIDDYYNYDDTSSPLGGVDMQDHNIGDQNAFSKWQYAWLAPYVIDDNAYIEMEPTTTSGQAVIIPSPDFNGTCYDEYFLLEFMAPVGLCEKDYKEGYQSTTGYTKPGLRITHVDARAYKNKPTEILDTPEKVATATQMRVLNTPSGRGYANWRDTFDNPETNTSRSMYMINIMQASGFTKEKNLLNSKGNSGNSDLFTKGFSFDLTPYYDSVLGEEFNDYYYLMPSYSNLWNKAQNPATREVDPNCTIDFTVTVLDVNKSKIKFVVEKI